MTWLELKNSYIKNHYSKMLAHPEIQVNTLLEIEEILSNYYPEIIQDPVRIKNYSKEVFTGMIRKKKPTGIITQDDQDVINGWYELLK